MTAKPRKPSLNPLKRRVRKLRLTQQRKGCVCVHNVRPRTGRKRR